MVRPLLPLYLVFRLCFGNELFHRRDVLVKRDDVSFTGCQEALGAPPIACKAEACGAKDGENRCSKIDCDCKKATTPDIFYSNLYQ